MIDKRCVGGLYYRGDQKGPNSQIPRILNYCEASTHVITIVINNLFVCIIRLRALQFHYLDPGHTIALDRVFVFFTRYDMRLK